MKTDSLMDTTDTNHRTAAVFDVDRFRLSSENDQQWFYRKQFIETFRFDYNEERLLCLAQCYANTKCLQCTYSEPLKSLLDQLSEKLSSSSIKRPTSQEPVDVNYKRNALMSNTTMSNVPLNSSIPSSPNFVSFSSAMPSKPPSLMPPPQIKQVQVDPKATLYESVETKTIRLHNFVDQLKAFVQEAQSRTGSNENDHAIEYIYQLGNQQRLFIDYRPDNSTDQLNSHGTHANSFLTQTFRGKLYIDEIYICAGQGTNKKLCKRNCFQQALNQLLHETFEIKLCKNKDGREQYELVEININDHQQESDINDNQEKESFIIPSNHPMSKTKMNFVYARDTTTIAGRTARQQSKLEQQYWQQWGRSTPVFTKPRRIHRPLSPPPPVPHETVSENTTVVIEALSTTTASVTTVIADMEEAAQQNQKQHENTNNKQSIYPFPIKPIDNQKYFKNTLLR